MPPSQRILIVRLSHLGDVVQTIPLLHALRSRFPGAELGWLTQPEYTPLVSALPGLDHVFCFQRRAGVGAWPTLAAELGDFAPQWCIDAQGNLKSAAATLASRASRRSGLARSDWTERAGSLAMTDLARPAPRPVVTPDRPSGTGRGRRLVDHGVERLTRLVEHVTGQEHAGLLRFELGLTDDELNEAELALGTTERPVLLHLGRPGDPRTWPPTSFGALAERLAEQSRSVVVVSGPAESEAGAELAQRISGLDGSVTHWVGQRGLRDLAARFAVAARRGGCLVAGDSGPTHLAAAAGLRVLLLAGPQDARRTGPWPAGTAGPHRVLRRTGPLACAPCLARSCHLPQGPICLSEITPDQVVDALRALPAMDR